ncbi:hypothetical protein [Falsiroseomonas sp. CW058]|uniref:hypothetical protein n=1 Tax=Falsiroseomonas sp. CW058 TaxID=3388664 RepID=UPI003D322F48
MPYPVSIGTWTFTAADFDGFNYVDSWEDYLSAIEFSIGRAAAAEAAASAASASLASAIAIAGGAQGVGADRLDLPRNADLGSAAFVDADALRGAPVSILNTSTQISRADFGRTILSTSGTLTHTLPAGADLPSLWWVRIKNRTGGNLTVARAGSETISGSASNLTLATGSSAMIARVSATEFEVL